nr:probable pectin methyltransferase QUA2 [Ipomoea batatas]
MLSPLIFSDHPKRPGDEDPSPPYNLLRNVLDMNARFGGLNAALLEAGKCEAFPTYPRTYDLVHAYGLLTLESEQHSRCGMLDLFIEIDRLTRPEVNYQLKLLVKTEHCLFNSTPRHAFFSICKFH